MRPYKPHFNLGRLSAAVLQIPVSKGFKKENLTDLYLYVAPRVSMVR